MPRYALPLQDVQAIVWALASGDDPALVKLPRAAARVKLSRRGAEGLARLAADLEGIPAQATSWELLATYLLDRTDTCAKLAESPTFEDRSRRLAMPIDAAPLDAVRLMTIRNSKGLEFEAVHVPGMAWASLPASYKAPRCPAPDALEEREAERRHDHEEECVLFVAPPRARRFLRFYYAERANGSTLRAPSPFLRWFAVDGEECIDVAEASQAFTPSPGRAIEVGPGDAWQVTAEQLELYEACPKRFFYPHVLGVRGAWRARPFARTHACMRELLRWSSARECTLRTSRSKRSSRGFGERRAPKKRRIARLIGPWRSGSPPRFRRRAPRAGGQGRACAFGPSSRTGAWRWRHTRWWSGATARWSCAGFAQAGLAADASTTARSPPRSTSPRGSAGRGAFTWSS
jgi:hypothetical protein